MNGDIEQTFEMTAVKSLATRLHGRLLQPGDTEYETARVVHNGAYARRPSVIVQAADTTDVVTAVNFAREHGVSLAVRSGGHSVAGHSTSDGMVLDLSSMNSIDIDGERRTARVGPGATWGEFSEAAQVHGLAVPSGDTSSVGVGGLTIGGGIGWLVRKFGLTIDSLLSCEIVLADGRVVTASRNTHEDLFWAIRGGGGNFGVVTSFQFAAHPVGVVVGGALFYDAANGKEVLRRYVEYASSAPDDLTTIAFVLQAPPAPFLPPETHGKLVIAIGICCTGDLSQAQQIVAPLRTLGTLIADVTGEMPYPAVYALTEEGTVMGHPGQVRSMFLREMTDAALDTILRHSNAMTSPFGIAQLRVLGGQMSRAANNESAFPHRDKAYMLTAINSWLEPSESEIHRAWCDRFLQDMTPFNDGVYVNFLDDEGEERIREAYGDENHSRLATIKATYDPTNFFRGNQNIQPATTRAIRSAA